ncbi:MAG: hypothetical protein GX058_06820 [Firmicutes bacterium]|nr:hypothetical protein [Bacillota bacterium]
MVDCRKIDQLLSAYIDQEVSPAESRAVRVHLERCSHCRNEYLQLVRTKELFSALEVVDLPLDFHSRFEARLEQSSLANRLLRWLESFKPFVYAGALGLLFGVIGMPLAQGTKVAKVEPFSDLQFLLVEHRRLQQSEPLRQQIPPLITESDLAGKLRPVSVAGVFEQPVTSEITGAGVILVSHHF